MQRLLCRSFYGKWEGGELRGEGIYYGRIPSRVYHFLGFQILSACCEGVLYFYTGSSPLRVYQGRIFTRANGTVDVKVFPVSGLATVELISSVTYYLDCNTLRNDGSGISWMRVGGDNPFTVSNIGMGNGQRLRLSGLSETHLGGYVCFDAQSEDRATINLTTGELFHLFE